MDITFTHLVGDQAVEAAGPEYVDVYMDIRTEPPYNAGPLYQRQRYTDRTSKQVASEGFALVSARDRAGALAGFAFGFRMPAGRWWGGNTTPVAELVDVDKFAVIELNLRKEYRGKGYGRKLLEELLAARPEQWAMLLSLPAAPAHAMYEHLGWEVVGTVQPAPDAEVADVMVLPLHVEGASAGA